MSQRYRLDTGMLCDRLADRVDMVPDKRGEWVSLADHIDEIESLEEIMEELRDERDSWINSYDDQATYVCELEETQAENCTTIDSLNEQIQELQNELKQYTSTY